MTRRSFAKLFTALLALIRQSKAQSLCDKLNAQDAERANLYKISPIFTEYEQDPEYLHLVTTTHQIVNASEVADPSVIMGVETRFERIGYWRYMKIVKTHHIHSYPDFERLGAYPRPYLFTDTSGSSCDT